jgi:exodeoxyribonuclease VII large subunit
MARHLRNRTNRIAQLEARLRRHDPSLRLAAAQRRFAAAAARLERAGDDLINRPNARLERASLRLDALSPLAVLNRGYAIVYAPDGSILRNATQARAGSLIRARLASGSLRATVLTNVTDSPEKQSQ